MATCADTPKRVASDHFVGINKMIAHSARPHRPESAGYFNSAVGFSACLGTVVWDNGLDLCPDTLYMEAELVGQGALWLAGACRATNNCGLHSGLWP